MRETLIDPCTAAALIVAPSRGLGGGIERYVETLEWAFRDRGIHCKRLNLYDPMSPVSGGRAKAYARLLAGCRAELAKATVQSRVVVAHRSLLPLASMMADHRSVSGISVICHGADVWGAWRPRRGVEEYLMRRRSVRVVAVSSFTAGALPRKCQAAVLAPGLSGEWFQTLRIAAAEDRADKTAIRIVTTFRLQDWRAKGLEQLLMAVSILGRSDVRVSVCGTGPVSRDLKVLLGGYRFCELRGRLTDVELAGELAAADVFVLATRTCRGRHPSGEGFGLALLEAQVAGTAVVGPAYGGSHDAYVEGVTGITPRDETPTSLARVLRDLLADMDRTTAMGRLAAEWACISFAPENYSPMAVAKLL